MWFLLMVLLTPVNGFQTTYRLNTFDTQEECQTRRNQVGFDMAEAYPYENDFIIVCQLNPKKET